MNAPLPPPSGGGPALAAPTAGGTFPAPTLPAPTVPSPSPAPGTSLHADGLASPASPLVPPTEPADLTATDAGTHDAPPDASTSRGRRSAPPWLAIVLVLAAAAGAWFMFGSTNDDEPTVPAATQSDSIEAQQPAADGGQSPASGTDSIGQIGADAISGAEDLVEIINDRDEETELLAELGLDPVGEPLADPPPAGGTAVGGHTFRWVDQSGATVTVTVAAPTGDYSLSSGGGPELRSIDGQTFTRVSAGADWVTAAADEIEALERLGLAGPLTVADLLGAARAFTTDEPGGATIDDATFAATDAASRSAWLSSVGLSDALDGPLWVSYDLLSDGSTLASATIERAATGEQVVYQLAELHQQPPTIDLSTD